MNPVVYFLLTFFGGIFGLHKFASGKKGMGILYLCTLGLFGIGWIIDIIVAFYKMYIFTKQPAPTPATFGTASSPTTEKAVCKVSNVNINDLVYLDVNPLHVDGKIRREYI